MTHSKPVTWTDTARVWQQWLMPNTGHAAGEWVNLISNNAEETDHYTHKIKHPNTAKTQMLALPIFAFLSTIQMGASLLCSFTLMCVGLDTNRTAILGENGILDLLVRSVAAFFTSIFVIPLAWNDLSIYVRPKQEVEEASPILDTPPPETIWSLDMILERFKVISPSNIAAISALNTGFDFAFTYEPEDTDPRKGNYVWDGLEFGQVEGFSQLGEAPKIPGPKIDSIDTFINPPGTIGLTIRTGSLETMKALLEPTTAPCLEGLDTLTLIGGHHDLRKQLLAFSTEGVLENLKVLALRDIDIYAGDLAMLMRQFPKIACFDLRGCTIKDRLDGFTDDYIIITDEGSNAQAQLDRLNEHVVESVHGHLNRVNMLGAFLAPPSKAELTHESAETRKAYYHHLSPAACFVPKLKFLRSLSFDEAIFKSLMGRFSVYFRSLQGMDLSHMPDLTHKCVASLSQFGLTMLSLRGCSSIYTTREIRKSTRFDEIALALPHSDSQRVINQSAYDQLMRSDESNIAEMLVDTLFCMVVNRLKILDISEISDHLDARSKGRFTRYITDRDKGLLTKVDKHLSQLRQAGIEQNITIRYGCKDRGERGAPDIATVQLPISSH